MTDPDPKLINRLALMLDHAARALKTEPPDLVIVEKLLGDAFDLVIAIQTPPDPYANKLLRPGLTVGEAAARGMIASPGDGGGDGIALTTIPHPEPRDV